MACKRLITALLLAAAPFVTPGIALADDGGPVLDFARPDQGGDAEVAGVQAQQSAADYAARLAGFPQPPGMRLQPGMVGLRALIRLDSGTVLPPGTSDLEVAGVQVAGGDADYVARREGWTMVSRRVSSGTVGLHALLRADSLYPSP